MGLYWKARQASTSVSKSDPTGNIEKPVEVGGPSVSLGMQGVGRRGPLRRQERSAGGQPVSLMESPPFIMKLLPHLAQAKYMLGIAG